MCRKQVEQQGGETSEYHTYIIHCLSAELYRSWQSFTTATNYAPSACQEFMPVLFFFISHLVCLFAFAKLKDGMNQPSCLSQHDIPANVFAHVCFVFLIDELRDNIRSCRCALANGTC